MGSMFVDEGLGRVAEKKFGDDEKPYIFLTVESLLKYVAPVAICGKLDDPTTGMRYLSV